RSRDFLGGEEDGRRERKHQDHGHPQNHSSVHPSPPPSESLSDAARPAAAPLDPNSPADATPACKACQEKVSGIPVVCQKRDGQDQAPCGAFQGATFLNTTPPFITKVTLRTAVMSFNGSPRTAMRSAA